MHPGADIGLLVKCPSFLFNFNQIWHVCTYLVVKPLIIELHKNLFSGSRSVFGHTDRHVEACDFTTNAPEIDLREKDYEGVK
jgi:hypothetical protein